jgi:transposase-like protein
MRDKNGVELAPIPNRFRSRVCERLLAGESIKMLSEKLSISTVTLYEWRRQSLIDHGLSPMGRGAVPVQVEASTKTVKTTRLDSPRPSAEPSPMRIRT